MAPPGLPGLEAGAAGADTWCMRDDAGGPPDDALGAVRAALDGVLADGGCHGTLVLHRDGTPGACSEVLDGRTCAGSDRPHAGVISCRDLLGLAGCEHCLADDRAWRHAVDVGTLAAGQRRCSRHGATTGEVPGGTGGAPRERRSRRCR